MSTTYPEERPQPEVALPTVAEDRDTLTVDLLTLRDRCDATASGSEAAAVIVWPVVGSEPLLLCGHHYDKNSATFAAKGYVVIDTREPVLVQ